MIDQHFGGPRARRQRPRVSALALSSVSSVALCALIATAPSGAHAQTAPSAGYTPAIHDTVDANGIDLVTGDYHPLEPSVSVGPIGQGGMSQAYTGQGITDNMTGRMSMVGSTATVSIGDRSETFTGGASDQASGSSFEYDAASQTATYTQADGTVALFEVSHNAPNQAITGRIVSLRRPTGETWNYHYRLFRPPTDSFEYDRIQSVTNNFGYQIKYEYDGAVGQELQIRAIHAVNNAVQACAPDANSCGDLSRWPGLTYSGTYNGALTATDSIGRQITKSHPANGVLQMDYPEGRRVTLAYVSNTPTSTTLDLTLPEGTSRYVFQRDDQSTHQPETTTVTDPLGHVTTVVSRRDLGVITQITDANNLSTSYTVEDETGRLTRVTRPEGDATEYEYDYRGNVKTVRQIPKPGASDPVLTSTAVFPDDGCTNSPACNQPLSTTDELGNTTDYAYDPTHGGLVQLTKPADAQGVRAVTHFAYSLTNAQALDAFGQLQTLSPVYRLHDTYGCAGADGCAPSQESRVSTGYSGANALPTISISYRSDGAEAAQTISTYDDVGDVIAQDGPLSESADTTTYVFDSARQLVGVIDPDPDGGGSERPRARRITYAGEGQVSLIEQGTVASSSVADWANFAPISYVGSAYDGAGRKTVETTGDSGQAPVSLTQYGYDAADRLHCVAVRMNPSTFGGGQPDACALGAQGSDGPDRITQYDYDAGSRLLVTTQAVGTPQARTLRSLSYTQDGLVQTEADGRGNLTTYGYDGLNRLRGVFYPNPDNGFASTGPRHLYDYQGLTRVSGESLRDGVATATSYDGRGQVTSATADNSSFTYDSFGRVLTAVLPGSALSNTYDSRGNLLSQTGPLGTVSYEYDVADRRTRMTWPDGFYVTYEYDFAGRLISIRENGALALTAFAYEGHDLRSGMSRANGVSTLYGYGPAGRLASLTQSAPSNGVAFSYGRNAAGQITSRASSNSAYSATPTSAAASYSVNGLNEDTSSGGVALQHNARGDTTNDGEAGYGYDELDRLTSSQSASLSYDALGRLFSAASTRFLYDGADLIAEYDGAGNLLHRYVHGPGVDEPLVAYDGAATGLRHWLLADERGSVVGSSGGDGATAATALDDYGRGSPVSRFGFTGQAWLNEAGVYHYKARAYSPKLGRFLQPDPSGDAQSAGTYVYTDNDPENQLDPSGLSPENNIGGVDVVGDRFKSLTDFIKQTGIDRLFRSPGTQISVPEAAASVPGIGHNGGPRLVEEVVVVGRRLVPRLLSGVALGSLFNIFDPVPLNAGEKEILRGLGNENKMTHVFRNPNQNHKLDRLIKYYGSERAAAYAIASAVGKQVPSGGNGTYSQIVSVGPFFVTVTGGYVDGTAMIGTAFIANH